MWFDISHVAMCVFHIPQLTICSESQSFLFSTLTGCLQLVLTHRKDGLIRIKGSQYQT